MKQLTEVVKQAKTGTNTRRNEKAERHSTKF